MPSFEGNLSSQAVIKPAPQVHRNSVPAGESFWSLFFLIFIFYFKWRVPSAAPPISPWKTHRTAVKVSLFLSSLVADWHAQFTFTLHFQLLASNCYFHWQVSRYQQIPQRVTFFSWREGEVLRETIFHYLGYTEQKWVLTPASPCCWD